MRHWTVNRGGGTQGSGSLELLSHPQSCLLPPPISGVWSHSSTRLSLPSLPPAASSTPSTWAQAQQAQDQTYTRRALGGEGVAHGGNSLSGAGSIRTHSVGCTTSCTQGILAQRLQCPWGCPPAEGWGGSLWSGRCLLDLLSQAWGTACSSSHREKGNPTGKGNPTASRKCKCKVPLPSRRRPGLWGLHSPWGKPIGQPHVWGTPLFQLS